MDTGRPQTWVPNVHIAPARGMAARLVETESPAPNVTDIHFQGVQFPSLLHAQWALFFDDLFIPWRFRVRTFALRDGIEYEPDFWLPTHQLWFQVGGETWDRADYEQWHEFAAAADGGVPCEAHERFERGMPCARHDVDVAPLLPEDWQARDVLYSVGGIPLPQGAQDPVSADVWHKSMYTATDCCYKWTSCPSCGFVGAEFGGRADRLSCGHGDTSRDNNCRSDDPRILAAYRLARQTTSARMQGNCARCCEPMKLGDLIAAGRAISSRRWYHADCLLASRRERYQPVAGQSTATVPNGAFPRAEPARPDSRAGHSQAGAA